MADFLNHLCEAYKLKSFSLCLLRPKKMIKTYFLSNPNFYDSITFPRDKKSDKTLKIIFWSKETHFLSLSINFGRYRSGFFEKEILSFPHEIERKKTHNFSKLKNKIDQIAKNWGLVKFLSFFLREGEHLSIFQNIWALT